MRYSLLFLAFVAHSCDAAGLADPSFAKYPFAKWKEGGNVSQIKWSPGTPQVRLSPYQRLVGTVDFILEMRECLKRRNHPILALLEITDSEGDRWQMHDTPDLRLVADESRHEPAYWVQEVFLVPGNYQIALALVDSQTNEYNFVQRHLSVASLHRDPLPEPWDGLPRVEYLHTGASYTPLHLPLVTTRSVHLEIIANATPSEHLAGSLSAFRNNMSTLLPALEALSGISPSKGSKSVTVIDLAERREWESSGPSDRFAVNTDPRRADIKTLKTKPEMLRFFQEKLRARLEAPVAEGEIRVVIVLSVPLFLSQQHAPENVSFGKMSNVRLIYLRDTPPPDPKPFYARLEGPPTPPADDIERILKPLGGNLFSVNGPDQFRKALALILAEISRI